MKDFDTERTPLTRGDREFKIRGQVFVRREDVRPEVLAGYDDLNEGTSARKTLEIVDDLIVNLIEDQTDNNGHARYRDLRARVDDPITLEDLLVVAKWLMSEIANRPTSPPSVSTGESESGETGTGSTESSSSTPVEGSPV